jgi:hypothetical protein
MSVPTGIDVCIESRLLPDGKGGIFANGELFMVCDSEAESDSIAILVTRQMVVAGAAIQNGQAFKDDKPMDLFDMSIR